MPSSGRGGLYTGQRGASWERKRKHRTVLRSRCLGSLFLFRKRRLCTAVLRTCCKEDGRRTFAGRPLGLDYFPKFSFSRFARTDFTKSLRSVATSAPDFETT